MGPSSNRFRINLALLFLLQALGSITTVVLATVNSVAGLRLASAEQFATLPITAFVLGSAITTFSASLLMARFGRTAGFRVGIMLGIVGSALCTLSVYEGSFLGLCLGSAILGGYAAFGAYIRFAAADIAPLAQKGRAISWVMTAGIVGALVGPNSTTWTKDLTSSLFVGTYASLIFLGFVALLVTLPLRLPVADTAVRKLDWLALRRVCGNARGRVAMLNAVVGYAAMLFLMTATPIAMHQHAHAYDDTAFVIQWHVLGMFAPSLVTGSLIRRFGVLGIMLSGGGLMLACIGLNLAGTTVWHFWAALLLLGVGWNFMFIGGTTLLAETFVGPHKAAAQGLNELSVFGSNAVASALSGVLLHRLGWQVSNLVAIPFVLMPIGLILRQWSVSRSLGPGAHLS